MLLSVDRGMSYELQGLGKPASLHVCMSTIAPSVALELGVLTDGPEGNVASFLCRIGQ